MLSGLEIALAAAAFAIGVTGTWSPCGFSMVETIGPTGHSGGMRTTLAACATFAPGAVAGGILTFAGLGAVGALAHGGGEPAAYLAAAAIAGGAAALEARGAPIVPQIRRQLPEHWRRVMPMPLAAGLYGGLLGLGFTTFVLSFGVWAIAAISLAVGEPSIGALIGAAFGVGRAIPIVGLAPFAGSAIGARVTELMAGRPGLYRGLRLGDAVALLAAAAMLIGEGDALADRVGVKAGADPSAWPRGLAYQGDDRTGVVRSGGRSTVLPGKDPAAGGRYLAVRTEAGVRVLDRRSLEPLAEIRAPNANALAISDRWLVWRATRSGRDRLWARRITGLDSSGRTRLVDSAGGGRELGMPSLRGSRVAYAIAGRRSNRIVVNRLGGKRRTEVRARQTALGSPTLGKGRLLYVRASKRRQHLLIKRLGANGERRLLSRRRGTLWSTSMTPKRAFVTHIRGSGSRIISASR